MYATCVTCRTCHMAARMLPGWVWPLVTTESWVPAARTHQAGDELLRMHSLFGCSGRCTACMLRQTWPEHCRSLLAAKRAQCPQTGK